VQDLISAMRYDEISPTAIPPTTKNRFRLGVECYRFYKYFRR
jgi:hypothetical protein